MLITRLIIYINLVRFAAWYEMPNVAITVARAKTFASSFHD